jgi:hypothetical protein
MSIREADMMSASQIVITNIHTAFKTITALINISAEEYAGEKKFYKSVKKPYLNINYGIIKVL